MKSKLIAAAVAFFFLAIAGAQTPPAAAPKPMPAEIQAKYWKLVALQYKAGNVRTAAKEKAEAEYEAVTKRAVDALNELAAEAIKAGGCESGRVVEDTTGLSCKK